MDVYLDGNLKISKFYNSYLDLGLTGSSDNIVWGISAAAGSNDYCDQKIQFINMVNDVSNIIIPSPNMAVRLVNNCYSYPHNDSVGGTIPGPETFDSVVYDIPYYNNDACLPYSTGPINGSFKNDTLIATFPCLAYVGSSTWNTGDCYKVFIDPKGGTINYIKINGDPYSGATSNGNWIIIHLDNNYNFSVVITISINGKEYTIFVEKNDNKYLANSIIRYNPNIELEDGIGKINLDKNNSLYHSIQIPCGFPSNYCNTYDIILFDVNVDSSSFVVGGYPKIDTLADDCYLIFELADSCVIEDIEIKLKVNCEECPSEFILRISGCIPCFNLSTHPYSTCKGAKLGVFNCGSSNIHNMISCKYYKINSDDGSIIDTLLSYYTSSK